MNLGVNILWCGDLGSTPSHENHVEAGPRTLSSPNSLPQHTLRAISLNRPADGFPCHKCHSASRVSAFRSVRH
jgi:hypothetical protein